MEPPLRTTPIVLGLLGAIGAGKTHVARRVAELGEGVVVDADALARDALGACARDGRLAEALGPACVDAEGSPDRAAIAERVFENPDALRALERLVHPAVRAEIKWRLRRHRTGTGPTLLVLDVPLLLETGLDRQCDVLWYVDAPESLRLERAAARGLTDVEVLRRERCQTPLGRKRAVADHVIVNDGKADLDAQILEGLRAVGLRAEARS